MSTSDFGSDSLGQFLERVASSEPAPGGGAAAAVAAALAAGLLGMVARFATEQVPDAADIAEEADRLRRRALRLAAEDAEAYGDVLTAFRLPRDSSGRPERIRAALERAADVPLAVAEVAAHTAARAFPLARDGNPNLRGDAVVAVLLADAAARGAAELVELNVTLGKLDGDWLERAQRHVGTTTDAARAVTTSP